MSTDPRRDAAIDRLKAKRGVRASIGSYLAVNVLLVVIWAFSGGFFWPIFTIVFGGFGVAMHAWSVYGQRPITEDDVRREMGREGGNVVD